MFRLGVQAFKFFDGGDEAVQSGVVHGDKDTQRGRLKDRTRHAGGFDRGLIPVCAQEALLSCRGRYQGQIEEFLGRLVFCNEFGDDPADEEAKRRRQANVLNLT